MLKSLQKYFNPASAEKQEEVTEMTTQEDQAALAADKTAVAELTANLASVTEAMATMQVELADVKAKYEAAQAALNASEAAKTLLAEQAAKARLEARTAAITEAVGTSQLESLLAATDSMDDAQFNIIVGAMAKSFENEAKSAMFQEAGLSNDTPVVEVDVAKKLADKFAAEFNTK